MQLGEDDLENSILKVGFGIRDWGYEERGPASFYANCEICVLQTGVASKEYKGF